MQNEPRNISTEHQPKGGAVNVSDTLDRAADSTDYQQVDEPGKGAADYRRELGDKPDSATVSHAPPSPDANPAA
jgi:hypothetical protein